MATFRIATFNVENLFTRVKVFLRSDHADGATILGHIDALQQHLDRATYDQAEILRRYRLVQGYIDLIEVRGKLFNRQRSKVLPAGRNDWWGWIRPKRQKFDDPTISNTAKVIKDVNADVVCLVEVESLPALRRFAAEKLVYTRNRQRQSYPRAMLIDAEDPRGIDVALLAKPHCSIGGVWSHVDDDVFSRDCLEVELLLPDGRPLWLLLNHFKSKGYGTQSSSDRKRRRQAERVAEILADYYDLSRDLVVVAGDLNDTPDSAPLAPLLAVPGLTDVLAAKVPDPAERWTYHYRQNQQIDYLLVSRPLADRLQAAGVHRKGMHDLHRHSTSGERQYGSVTRAANAASDHGAVWADFDL